MLELLRQSWDQVQEDLERRVGAAAYDSWLSGLRPLAMDRGIVYLEAPARLTADRVARLYSPVLSEVLSGEIGTHVAVQVLAPPETDAPGRLEVGPADPVIDDSNRTAFLVLKSLLQGRNLPSNLFFFHGPSGVGKSFLLRWWIGLSAARPMVFDLPSLTRAFQACHHDGKPERLRDELVRDEPLVLDEVHRIARKQRLQQMLLEVLDRRERLAVPTLLASRWDPREIHDLQPSLASRFLSGFVAKIEAPGALGRLRYLRALAGSPSRNGRRDEVEAMARDLRGTWGDLRRAWQQAKGEPGKHYLQLIEPKGTFQRLCDHVCSRLDLAPEDLLGPSQSRKLSTARKVLAWLCVQEGLSRAEVGRFMHGRSRAAISYMTRTLEKAMADSPDMRALVEGLL